MLDPYEISKLMTDYLGAIKTHVGWEACEATDIRYEDGKFLVHRPTDDRKAPPIEYTPEQLEEATRMIKIYYPGDA